ncbi:MAG: sugar phosphate isomerase/epimerase [Clostridiales bacterium]|jgi:sugar phosphate isomerase/epimerase|nr:sugar phosphate isomerase/epimerase [Clostridiales bacterium]
MFKISGFYDEATGLLDGQISLINELGGRYLCPRVIDGKNIADYTAAEFESGVLPRLNQAGIRLSSLGSPIGKIKLHDGDAFKAQCVKLKELIKIAQMTECEYIRCFSFFTDGAADAKTAAKVIDRWRVFLEIAEGSGVTLLHENEKKIYGDVPDRVLELYDALDHPNFKLCYDASNYIQCGIDPWEAYQKTKKYTVYYHMKDCLDGVEVPLGEGRGKIAEIIADLKARGYNGFVTLEPHTAKYALTKKLVYILPFLLLTKYGRVFRGIDKTHGIKPLQSVTRKDVFVWQYENLVKIIDAAGGKTE